MKSIFIILFTLFFSIIYGQNHAPSILASGSVVDYDGHVYNTVNIGAQTWISENLKVTHFNDGTKIKLYNGTDGVFWPSLTTPGYSWYSDDSLKYNNLSYGCLYNWHCVNTSKLCMTGWRVPSYDDWNVLLIYLGENSGIKLKNSFGWLTNNGTNTSQFNAVSSGDRWNGYQNTGVITEWWSSTILSPHFAKTFGVDYYYTKAYHSNFTVESGWPVRCLKN